jgi:putative phosphoesterase
VRLALISDVHGNLPALEAVVEHAREAGADRFVHAGDLVGYGGFPQEVADTLRRLQATTIAGDFDLRALEFAAHPERFDDDERHPPQKRRAYRWAHDRLDEPTRQWLSDLPRELRFEIDGLRFLLVHGSPASFTEHLYADTDVERLAELAETAHAHVVICGHSHEPFSRDANGVLFVNPGSVGRQDDGDYRTSYALLDVTAHSGGRFEWEVRLHRLDWDLERELEALERFGLPEEFRVMMRQGRGLGWVRLHGDPDDPSLDWEDVRRSLLDGD